MFVYPKTIVSNLKWRAHVLTAAEDDRDLQDALWQACRMDVLFWLNTFCWLYEPRPRFDHHDHRLPMKIPFVTWPHQDKAIREIVANLGMRDIGVEKARSEGASWIAVLLALHEFIFEPLSLVGMVSSTEKKCDNAENPDSLFWKIDWELQELPEWMAGVKGAEWDRNLTDHTIYNNRNKARICGFAATAGVGRGGRYKWFLMDELAEWERGRDTKAMNATQQATDSRLVISTPCGAEGEYYDFMHRPSNMVKVILDWKDNPTKNRGLYHYERATCKALSADNPLPFGYEKAAADLFSRLREKGFTLDGTTRSPWYDDQCDRPDSTPTGIAQELDRDYGGSMYRIFKGAFFDRTKSTVRLPTSIGEINYQKEDISVPCFEVVANGPVQIWVPLDALGRPPKRQYVVGCDVSTGLGGVFTSNSVAEVFDVVTQEQVLEYATNTVEVADFTDDCIAICKLFWDAYLIWEVNGPGSAFTKRIMHRRYSNVYYRRNEWARGKKKTKSLGWWTDRKSKESMFSTFQDAVKSGGLILRSKELSQECSQYVRLAGKIEHVSSRTHDDSITGEAHGDRVIAAAVAVQGIHDRPLFTHTDEPGMSLDNPPLGTMAWRMKRLADMDRAANDRDGWDDRTTASLVRI